MITILIVMSCTARGLILSQNWPQILYRALLAADDGVTLNNQRWAYHNTQVLLPGYNSRLFTISTRLVCCNEVEIMFHDFLDLIFEAGIPQA
jgi:hypothetical protein